MSDPKRSRRGGRGRSKRPREPEEGGPHPPRDASASHGFAPINFAQQSNSSSTLSQPTRLSKQEQPPALGPAQFSGPAAEGLPGKVAIPSLHTSRAAESLMGSKKGRTSHACDLCRKAKTGCSGQQPCARCKSANVPCVYGDGKRDKEKK